jgi:hypothetical protein
VPRLLAGRRAPDPRSRAVGQAASIEHEPASTFHRAWQRHEVATGLSRMSNNRDGSGPFRTGGSGGSAESFFFALGGGALDVIVAALSKQVQAPIGTAVGSPAAMDRYTTVVLVLPDERDTAMKMADYSRWLLAKDETARPVVACRSVRSRNVPFAVERLGSATAVAMPPRSLQSRHHRRCPVGSQWSSGANGPDITMDATDFCSTILGRGSAEGLLTTLVPF